MIGAREKMENRKMNRGVVLAALMLATGLATSSWGAISVGISSAVTETFDGMGTSATATLPTDWSADKIATARTLGTVSAASTTTNYAAGANMSTSASNGIYNYGNSTTSADRALGFISSSSATKSGNLYGTFMAAGADLTSLTISYDVEKYRNGTNTAGFSVQMYYSLDGATWTTAGTNFLTNFVSTDATNTGYATVPSITSSVVSQSLSLPVANGSNFYLAWNYSVSTGTTTSNAIALGLDNISILGVGEPTPTQVNLTWSGNTPATGPADVSGTWGGSGDAANWWGTSASKWDDSIPNNASFGTGSGTGSVTVTLAADRTAGNVTFVAGSPTYTLTGNTLNVNTGITVNENAGINSNLNLTADQSITLAADKTLTLGGNLSGGTLTVVGPGTLDLQSATGNSTTGTNLQSGTVVVNDTAILGAAINFKGGTLKAGTSLNFSGVPLNFVSSGTVDTNGLDVTYSNDLYGGDGTSTIIKEGAGKLTLTGTSYTAAYIRINTGTLEGNTNNLLGSLNNSATVNFQQDSDGIYAGSFVGAGTFNKNGSGNLILSGYNNSTGTLNVNAGILTATASGLRGTIVNNTAIVIDQSVRATNVPLNGTVTADISGPGSLTKNNDGIVTLAGNNSYTGGTTVNGGTLVGTTTSLQGNLVTNATLAFSQTTAGTFAGPISGSGVVAKQGSGVVTLTGNNTYAGGTNVTGGTLVAGTNTALSTGTVTVNNGTLYAAADTNISNAITVTGSSTALLAYWNFNNAVAGVSGALGTFSTTGTTEVYTEGSKTLAPATSGVVAASATVDFNGLTGTMGGSANNNWGTFAGDVTNMIDADGTGAGQALTVVGSGNNSSYVVFKLSTLNFANLAASYATRGTTTGYNTQTWAYSTDGTSFTDISTVTDTNVASWTAKSVSLAGLTALENQSTVYLKLTLAGASTTSGNNRIDNVQFTGDGNTGSSSVLGSDITSGSATFSGNITLENSGYLSSAAGGKVVFSGVIADGSNGSKGVTKIGDGTVVLSGPNTYTGGTTASRGTLIIQAGARPSGDVLSLTSSTVNSVTAGGKVILVGGTASVNTYRATLATSFATGNWDGGGSIVAGTATAGNHQGIGYLTAADYVILNGSIAGYTASGADLLMKYTYMGDVNLDGTINGIDFAQIDASYLIGTYATGTSAHWINGDFNYDGQVTVADYAIIDAAFTYQLGGSALANARVAADEARFGAEFTAAYESAMGSVPEPGSLALLVLAGAGLVARRRR